MTTADALCSLASNLDADPAAVAREASDLLPVARREGEPSLVCRVATLRARALRNLRDVESAERAIDEALSFDGAADDDDVADAHLVAASICSFSRGAEQADHHLGEADRLGSACIRADVAVQRAMLAHREGRLDEALDGFAAALERLESAGDGVKLARVLSNRATLLVLRGDAAQAFQDFERARELFVAANQAFAVAVTEQNIAWARVHSGDIAGALAILDRADLGQHRVHDVEASRAKALMAAGLFNDAADLLGDLSESLQAAGDDADAAEALLHFARARRIAGHPSRRDAAQQAAEIFDRLGQEGRADQARLESMLARADDHAPTATDTVEAVALAERLESSGHLRSVTDAWAIATTRWLHIDDVDRASSCATRCESAATALAFVEHRLAAAGARAAVVARQGDAVGAMAVIADALDEFDEHRSTIGSPDARSGARLHATALQRLGADIAHSSGDSETLLRWSERRRNEIGTWHVAHYAAPSGTRPVGDTEPTEPLRIELRSVLGELRDGESGPTPSGRSLDELLARRTELETELRGSLLRAGSPRRVPALFDTGLIGRFDETVGVTLDIFGSSVTALVVHRGEVERCDIGKLEPLVEAVQAAAKMTAAAARTESSGPVPESTLRRLRGALCRLDHLAIDPLQLPAGSVVLTMPEQLHAAPWSSVPSLRGRDVTMATSLAAWSRAREAQSCDPKAPSLAALAGPRLDHADHEVELVARHYEDVRVHREDDAAAATLAASLADVSVVHVAAHTRVRRDNAMWSTLELADRPLSLFELSDRAVNADIVVLSSCESATGSGAPGAELPGLASALVSLGATWVVATISVLPDSTETAACLDTMHRHLAQGASPAAALRSVRAEHPHAIASHSLTAWSGR